MEGKKCMKCKATTSRLDARQYELWYTVKENKKTVGYQCAKCYDKIRRLPLFKNFKENFKEILKQRRCSNCGGKTRAVTRTSGHKSYQWHKDGNDGFLCNNCYDKTIRTPEINRAGNMRRMIFKDKVIHLPKNPRTGVCSLCGNKVGEGIKKTNIHHLEYHDDDPLKGGIEICPRCHIKESMKKYNVGSLRWKTPIKESII
jgi:hypothetical protein